MSLGGENMKWSVTEQGLKAIIEVWREDDKAGLYKVWLVGHGGRCLLGTLIPEEGRLQLRRTLSIDSLRRQGVWPVLRVEEQMVCSFRESASPIRWEDEVLRAAAQKLPRHTLQRTGEDFTLSFPFNPRTPFPLTPVFCFARIESGWLFFSFHKGGLPYIFQQEGKNREEVDEQRREPYGKSDHQGTGRSGRSAGL